MPSAFLPHVLADSYIGTTLAFFILIAAYPTKAQFQLPTKTLTEAFFTPIWSDLAFSLSLSPYSDCHCSELGLSKHSSLHFLETAVITSFYFCG